MNRIQFIKQSVGNSAHHIPEIALVAWQSFWILLTSTVIVIAFPFIAVVLAVNAFFKYKK